MRWRAGGLGHHLVRRVRRQRSHHVRQRLDARAAIGLLGGGEALAAGVLVQGEDLVLRHRPGLQRDCGRTQQRIARLHRAQLLDAAPLDLEVGAGVAHDALGAQVQEGRAARAPAVFDRAQHVGVAAGQVEAVGEEIVEVGAVAEALADPAGRRLHRDADAVVLADVQHRRRQLLVSGPRRGVERRLRGRVVGRRVAERADRDRIVGNRQTHAEALAGLDRHRGAQRLRQVRGDGRSLRQYPQRLAAPHLVAPAAGRVLRAGREAQRRVRDRIHARQLAEALGHEAAAAVVQERRIGVAGRARDHRVAFVATGADGVEDLVLHPQHARHQVQVARDQLRFEQLPETAGVQRAAVEDGLARCRLRQRLALPVAHEGLEVDVADLGAIEALHAGRDGVGNGREHGSWSRECEGTEASRRSGAGVAHRHEAGGLRHPLQPALDLREAAEVEAALFRHVGIGE